MLKPAGSRCNLDCKYCYYLDKAELYGGREPVMSDAMLETVVRRVARDLRPAPIQAFKNVVKLWLNLVNDRFRSEATRGV